MKRLVTGLLASLLLANALPAWAHRDGFHPGPPYVRHHHHHHRHGIAPLGWIVGGIALGSALVTITAPRPAVAAPTIVVSPPPPPPPARTAWFCQSYQAYYPYVTYCPEGWQSVVVY